MSIVKVIADSISEAGKRITTLECKYWRAIHSEIMTHRAFARNAASSRAIPFLKLLKPAPGSVHNVPKIYVPSEDGQTWQVSDPKCTVGMLERDPFIPTYIGVEQKGMQSGEQLSEADYEKAQIIIKDMLNYCMQRCLDLNKLGVHKSIINRYLEPWSYITVVITATEWDNFFKLRIHSAAEKHFNALAVAMKEAMDASKPVLVEHYGWHLPYLDHADLHTLNELWRIKYCGTISFMDILKRVSAARCARVSYLTQDGKRSIEADLQLADKLMNPGDGAIHASPFEHVATPMLASDSSSGPFIGWKQYRKEIPGETYIRSPDSSL